MRPLTVLRLLTRLVNFQSAADGVCVLLQTASITPTAAPELVREQIEDVVKEIGIGVVEMKELRKTKPEGWLDELAYLCEKDKQLREKVKQLRKKELLLLRKPDT